jgi:hypothetical protein
VIVLLLCFPKSKASGALPEKTKPDQNLRSPGLPLKSSPEGLDDVNFLAAADDEVKVRLRIEADGSLTIVTLAPNTRYADALLDNVPPDRVRTELCG